MHAVRLTGLGRIAVVLTATLLATSAADAQRRGGRRAGGAGRVRAPATRPEHRRAEPVRRPERAPQSTKAADRDDMRGIERDRAHEQPRNRSVDVDNSRRNANVNVDRSRHVEINQRNTAVRANRVAYTRPPYRHGGHRYYSYHPYHFHSYSPYSWGPSWHPWGFFVATMAVTAVAVTVANQQYYYDAGTYYVPSNGGYTVVAAPVGATVTTLPSGSQPVVVNETTNYYYGGTFYEQSGSGYKVVAPTAGAVVEHLPEGGEEVKVGDQTFVKVGSTYYQPIQRDGKNMWEVVKVEEGQ